jgi:Icc-related predicted phosphoesterase
MSHYIRLTSDIHNEFCSFEQLSDHFKYVLPPLQTDKDSILIVAGDFCNFVRPSSYERFIDYIKDKFEAIILIAGNHEFYGGIYPTDERDFKKLIKPLENMHYLSGTKGNKSEVVINDIQFIGNTLWTDFNNADVAAMYESGRFMNDYNLIKKENDGHPISKYLQYISPEDLLKVHRAELNKIEYHLKRKKEQKQVVITHHGSTMRHIHPKYANAGLSNYSFTSDLEKFILKYQPKYWFSGHTHESIDITVGKTRCLVNPAGYKSRYGSIYENQSYNPELVLEI